jgi:beta-glucosidase
MSADTPALPDGFIVGASTAAHQIEGGNTASDWWAYEQAHPDRLQPSGSACDSFHRWPEDMDLLAAAGLQAYRFSIEWSRIEPVNGEFSDEAVEHYRRMVVGARERGLEPIVTLHHFTNPAWFVDGGGWLHSDATRRFVSYLERIAPVLDAGVERVITINEPNMVAIMHRVLAGDAHLDNGLGGGLPLPHEGVRDALIRVHQGAREFLHTRHRGLRVGWSVANQAVQFVDGGEERASAYREAIEDVWLRAAAEDDHIGVQAYTRTVFGPEGKVEPEAHVARTTTGWEYYPAALEEAIRHTADVIPGVPMLVTENGISTRDDSQRIAYTRDALQGLGHCLEEGIDVRGYLHWSLLDNFEWGNWEPTFGLIAVDRETFARTPKPSLAWLGALAADRRL